MEDYPNHSYSLIFRNSGVLPKNKFENKPLREAALPEIHQDSERVDVSLPLLKSYINNCKLPPDTRDSENKYQLTFESPNKKTLKPTA